MSLFFFCFSDCFGTAPSAVGLRRSRRLGTIRADFRKNKGYTACFAAFTAYTPCLCTGRRISVPRNGYGICLSAGQLKNLRVSALYPAFGSGFSAAAYFYVKNIFRELAGCKVILNGYRNPAFVIVVVAALVMHIISPIFPKEKCTPFVCLKQNPHLKIYFQASSFCTGE